MQARNGLPLDKKQTGGEDISPPAFSWYELVSWVGLGWRGDLRQFSQGLVDLLLGKLVVRKLAIVVSIVGSQVEMTMPAVGDDNALLLAGLLALKRFINAGLYCVSRLRSRQRALGAGKGDSRLEDLILMEGSRLNDALID